MKSTKPATTIPPRLTLTFRPHPLVRSPHTQTVVASFVSPSGGQAEAHMQELVLDAGNGIWMHGYYSPQPTRTAKGVAIFIHGWLGGADSTYNRVVGEYLFQRGYAIFRLNLRDHGGVVHLNDMPFRGDRLREVAAVVRRVQALTPDAPLHLVGSSLGGNFALRLAMEHTHTSIGNLQQTVCICPVMNPHHVIRRLDSIPLYLAHFRMRWRKMMQSKQTFFPDLDFSNELEAKTAFEMIDSYAQRFGPFSGAAEYFSQYTLAPTMLADLSTPITIIAAEDDPVIPIESYAPFERASPQLQISRQPYGGHAGFVDLFPLRLWTCEAVGAVLG